MEEDSKTSSHPSPSILGAARNSAPALFLILVAFIGFASGTMYSSFVKPKDGSKTPMEQGISAINEAEKAKQLLEQKNMVTELNTPHSN